MRDDKPRRRRRPRTTIQRLVKEVSREQTGDTGDDGSGWKEILLHSRSGRLLAKVSFDSSFVIEQVAGRLIKCFEDASDAAPLKNLPDAFERHAAKRIQDVRPDIIEACESYFDKHLALLLRQTFAKLNLFAYTYTVQQCFGGTEAVSKKSLLDDTKEAYEAAFADLQVFGQGGKRRRKKLFSEGEAAQLWRDTQSVLPFWQGFTKAYEKHKDADDWLTPALNETKHLLPPKVSPPAQGLLRDVGLRSARRGREYAPLAFALRHANGESRLANFYIPIGRLFDAYSRGKGS